MKVDFLNVPEISKAISNQFGEYSHIVRGSLNRSVYVAQKQAVFDLASEIRKELGYGMANSLPLAVMELGICFEIEADPSFPNRPTLEPDEILELWHGGVISVLGKCLEEDAVVAVI